MCGLLGEYKFSGTLSKSQDFKGLLSLSKHRGPDSTKIYTDTNFQLGFNRLALLDLTSAGEQPKISPSNRYHLVFNGEIYNYKLLQEKYNLRNLASTSDTEVLLHIIDKIGVINSLKELNGMFAIAIIDTVESKTYLARDFAGIKPLFYGLNEKGLVFASQFDQIFKHVWFKNTLSLRADIVKEYFAFGYMQSPNTIYNSISQINPGECISFDSNGNISIHVIKTFNKNPDLSNKKYKLNSIKDKLQKAVELQSKSDRSLASFLSGGIDSSLIVSYAKKIKSDIEAFTLKVDSKKYNESDFAKAYAEHLNVRHKLVEAKQEDILKVVDEHFEAFSEPFGDYSSIPTYLVTKRTKKYHTAMLSGDGGDELFWGYPRMYDAIIKAFWFRLPYGLRKLMVRITNRLGLTNTYAPFYSNLQEFWMWKHIKLPKEVLNSIFKQDFSAELMNLYRLGHKNKRSKLQNFLKWNEFYGHMQRILIKVDRTSMRNSLEVRVPFLDKHVIDEAWQSKFSINKISGLKLPLKELLKQEIPEDLLMQEKKGFSVPIEDWFRSNLRQDLIEKTLHMSIYGNAYFNEKLLKQYVKDFLDLKHDNGWGIWHIYAWQNWALKSELIEL
jgi:asparagine synthase (glutamine-hydrolysing)